MSLLVIDMQPYFAAANDPFTIDAVCEEIKKAKEEYVPVFIVEYYEYGPTNAKIVEAVKGYCYAVTVTKFRDDGSAVIVPALEELYRLDKPIRVCGVNTNACVVSTVTGIIRKKNTAKIVAVKNACNDQSNGKGSAAWEKFDRVIKGLDGSSYYCGVSLSEELVGNISVV